MADPSQTKLWSMLSMRQTLQRKCFIAVVLAVVVLCTVPLIGTMYTLTSHEPSGCDPTTLQLLNHEQVIAATVKNSSTTDTSQVATPFVVAIMAIWDEALPVTLPLALDSSRHFVTEYFIVHKRGTDNTADVLRACIDKWGLRVRYLESNMTLREARMFAIGATRDYADVYLLQDGDEVMYTRGPTALPEALPLLFGAGYDVIASKMVYLKHNLRSTYKDSYVAGSAGKWGGHPNNGIMLIPHPTIFRNVRDRIIMPSALTEDVPQVSSGRYIVMHEPWKFDISVKHPLREYLRIYFYDWSAAGSPGTIEGWAATHDASFIDAVAKTPSWTLEDSARNHVDRLAAEWLSPYKEDEWHAYPDAIRVYLDAGRDRGYDGGEILSAPLP